MPLEGDWGKLQKLISGFADVGRDAMPAATKAAKEGVSDEYAADFSQQRDPWGEPWPATAKGKRPALIGPTRSLSNPIISATSNGVKLRAAPYWVFHQAGANNMQKRAVLPFGPSQWDAPITDKVEDAVLNTVHRLLPPPDSGGPKEWPGG